MSLFLPRLRPPPAPGLAPPAGHVGRAGRGVEAGVAAGVGGNLLVGPAPSWASRVLRWRPAMVCTWGVVQLLLFNGQWRVGLDSALYRHVARSLSQGQGYTVAGEPQTMVYPGLPYLLAGLNVVFGEAAWSGIVAIMLAGAAAVGLIYLLMREVMPAWAATVVAAGCAFNPMFVMHTHEHMTDVPFLLGVVATLLGLEYVARGGRRRRAAGVAMLVAGLGLAAVMRPTFWVLAAAVAAGTLWTAWRAVRGRAFGSVAPRAAGVTAGVAVAGAVLAGGLFLWLDPRTDGVIDPVAGEYEAEVWSRLVRIDTLAGVIATRLVVGVLDDHLVRMFFTERVVVLNVLAGVTLLVGTVWVWKVRPSWALLVGGLISAVLLYDSQSRYFLMVLPVLWAAWLAVLTRATGLLRRPKTRDRVLAGVLVVMALVSLGHFVKLGIEQRSGSFLDTYRKGQYRPVYEMARVVRAGTRPDDVVIGPAPRVLAYWSDRRVLSRRDLFAEAGRDVRKRMEAVKASGAGLAVFPAEAYSSKDQSVGNMIKDLLLVPANVDDSEVFFGPTVDGVRWYLARFEVDDFADKAPR